MMNNSSYDSTQDTKAHIQRVNELGQDFISVLSAQLECHDASKLAGIEKQTFDTISPLLKQCAYGTPEYQASLEKMREGIDAHYKNNSHHPEHFSNGIAGMNLFDLAEMFIDWKAACERTKDGNIQKTLEIQAQRFKLSPEMCSIFANTVQRMGWGG